MPTTIFQAKAIHTMTTTRPMATHVAVRDGRILGVGTLKELERWGDYRLDTTFADKVLLPGFVEGHAHASAGPVWDGTYLGWYDRTDPEGKVWKGLKTVDDIVARLKKADAAAPGTGPLIAWGLDPIYMDNVRITRQDLDRATTERAILITHASGHIMSMNSKGLEDVGLLKQGLNHPAIPLGADGLPMGELLGPEVMVPAATRLGYDRRAEEANPAGMKAFTKVCVRAGVTTIADLARTYTRDDVDKMLVQTAAPDFPICLVPFRHGRDMAPKDLIAYMVEMKAKSTERLELGNIKLHADGSIQGFTARLRWPGYQNGAPNGLWYLAPEQLTEILEGAFENGLLVHVHTNGDEASELVIDTVEKVLKKIPAADNRTTLQHCQMATPAQFRKAARLGMCVNLFANHHWFWGDEHYKYTVGPERAERMNACRTALDMGVPMTIHSDAPVTPLGPLFTAWAAVNRLTPSGRVQGEAEKITVAEALQAITLGAAFTMKMDHLIGSIEAGKRADFAVLDEDPYKVAPEALKDVPVWGTVQGGRVFPVAGL
ncbi:amidohydrolase [Chachezhania sediminis]|uniref:amidohydrolase n=1 Tax=Chachezhania sediminis TaxID=2599291 RepID=UPI001E381DF4|nr:amidohydrolase [Chachezhania sediminis]